MTRSEMNTCIRGTTRVAQDSKMTENKKERYVLTRQGKNWIESGIISHTGDPRKEEMPGERRRIFSTKMK